MRKDLLSRLENLEDRFRDEDIYFIDDNGIRRNMRLSVFAEWCCNNDFESVGRCKISKFDYSQIEGRSYGLYVILLLCVAGYGDHGKRPELEFKTGDEI